MNQTTETQSATFSNADFDNLINGHPVSVPITLDIKDRFAIEQIRLLRAIKGGINFFIVLTILAIIVNFLSSLTR